MNIDDLTLGQAKELANLFSQDKKSDTSIQTLSRMVGKHVIVRTYSAGVWFGKIAEKAGKEVIIEDARRLYYWKTNGGISLSEVSITGLHDDSKVCAPVDSVWLEAIELIPCTVEAVESIQSKKDHVVR